MKRYTTVALAAFLLTSLAGSSAQAALCKPSSAKIALAATKDGENLGFIGTATIQTDLNCNQLFGLTISGKMEDGEMLTVVAETKAGMVAVGGVEMFDSIGQLVLDSTQDLSGIFPLSELSSVHVMQAPTGIKTRKPPTVGKAAKAPARLQAPMMLLEGWF
jgi:hypothetical protein